MAVDWPGVNVWLSRREVREDGRRGVDGREGGWGWAREAEVEVEGGRLDGSVIVEKVYSLDGEGWTMAKGT